MFNVGLAILGNYTRAKELPRIASPTLTNYPTPPAYSSNNSILKFSAEFS